MADFTNRELLSELLHAIYGIINEKTNQQYAEVAVITLLEKLEKKFPFLHEISLESNQWTISYDIRQFSKKEICKAIEAIIRIVYMDLKNEAGLFFLSEIEVRTKPGFITEIRENGTDLDLLKIEHHVLFRNLNRLKLECNKTDQSQNQFKKNLYKDTNQLMNLEEIEKEFLILLQSENITQDFVLSKLQISVDEMHVMLSRLINFKLLHFVTNDEVELTEKGDSYVKSLAQCKTRSNHNVF